MQGMRDAVLDTFGVAGTQITLGSDPPPAFKMDAPERTGMNAHFASHAGAFIHDNRFGIRIPSQGRRGADLHAEGGFALLTGHGRNGSLIQVDVYPYIGVSALKAAGIME